MSTKSVLSLTLASAILLGLCSAASAAAPGAQRSKAVAQPSADAAALSPKQRGDLTRQMVIKWGDYVQQVHGVPVRTWARRRFACMTT